MCDGQNSLRLRIYAQFFCSIDKYHTFYLVLAETYSARINENTSRIAFELEEAFVYGDKRKKYDIELQTTEIDRNGRERLRRMTSKMKCTTSNLVAGCVFQ